MKNPKNDPIKVVELFAGVGGFRLGLTGTSDKPKKGYEVVWANQWEPSNKVQHAALVYKNRFHQGKDPNPLFNEDINKVVNMNPFPIPKHHLLVGGFPCQDYSIARTLSHAAGIEGKKGVLWWAIHKTLEKRQPKYLMLENVDRLLKSPVKQRGRDFGIILASLSDLGYAVEWRVINAADYGMPQRRRRIFIMGYRKNTPIHRTSRSLGVFDWITKHGVMAQAFPVMPISKDLLVEKTLEGDLANITEKFAHPFENTGFMIDRKIFTLKTRPDHDGPKKDLGSIIETKNIPKEYFLDKNELERWKYLKGGKKEVRMTKSNFSYTYNEGPVAFPDPLDRPSRTIITGEGGSTPSRFKHVIRQNGKYRRLMPVELERLCMFPDHHTAEEGIGDSRRAFFMGNALVVGVIEKLADSLSKTINSQTLRAVRPSGSTASPYRTPKL